MQNLPNSWQESTASTPQEDSISLYNDVLADTKDIIFAQVEIRKAFPMLPADFYDSFDNRIRANKFTVKRLTDAVNCVIDNCLYPTPTIAQFISFDRRVKFYTYEEMLKMSCENVDMWKNYAAIDLGLPKKVWCHVNDIEKYNIHE